MNPLDITTSGIRVVRLIRNTGDGGYSIAELRDRNKQTLFGIRWNGDDESDIGYPSARGYPVWFMLPDEVETILLAHFDVMAHAVGREAMGATNRLNLRPNAA